jgi:hypothetical protein
VQPVALNGASSFCNPWEWHCQWRIFSLCVKLSNTHLDRFKQLTTQLCCLDKALSMELSFEAVFLLVFVVGSVLVAMLTVLNKLAAPLVRVAGRLGEVAIAAARRDLRSWRRCGPTGWRSRVLENGRGTGSAPSRSRCVWFGASARGGNVAALAAPRIRRHHAMRTHVQHKQHHSVLDEHMRGESRVPCSCAASIAGAALTDPLPRLPRERPSPDGELSRR